jgi:DNA-binding response OmpR family regulator
VLSVSEDASMQQDMPRNRLLLLVVDPELSRDSTLGGLTDNQVDVLCTSDPAEALLLAGTTAPDAVLAAAHVPPLRGAAIARLLHDHTAIPTIVGIGDNDGAEAVAALANGAVACVPRPYRTTEILALLRSVAPPQAPDKVLEVGELRLDPAAHDVRLRGLRMHLPPREFQLLHLLMRHAGRVVTRAQIASAVWGHEDGRSNTVNVHICRLRAHLGDDPRNPWIVISVRGTGYRLDAPSMRPG